MVVHGTFLNATDHALERLARHRDRLCVVVCPRTTQLISGLLPPLALFRRAGIRLAIGTDSRASNPDLSLLAECRTLVAAGLASPTEVLTMATRNGAWGLMQERRCGVLHPGRRADLVILRPTATALRDPLEAVLDPTTRIETTLRSGRIIAGTLLP
jgi:cytosine/adenosine deaminase-related metal-dependent hydrolase